MDNGLVTLGIDGDCAYALLGSDLQNGEVEFIKLAKSLQNSQFHQVCACSYAFGKLMARLDRPDLLWVFDESHPYGLKKCS